MRWVLLWWAAGFLPGVHAAPHTPADDAEVVERLPGRPADPALAELRQLRAKLAAAPGDSATAAQLAQRYFELASAEGDPRYVGYAEGVLRPWKAEDAPVEVLFMRGVLRQYRHDFDGAIQELGRALQRDPELTAGHAWRAAIFMVQADYPAAARECAALEGRASELLATGCSAYVEATTGNARSAYRRLGNSLRAHPDSNVEMRLWVLTRLAEMAWRLDEPAAAERHFRDALSLGVTDNFLLAAYSDFLLDQGRPKEVLALLKDWTRSDTLLLRLALAARALKLPAAQPHVQALAARFEAAALHGERLHLQEEARFLLHLRNQPKAALAAAAENWKTQREPRDAEVLLEAALAARAGVAHHVEKARMQQGIDRRGEPQAAAPALRWLEETRFESGRLRRLALQLR